MKAGGARRGVIHYVGAALLVAVYGAAAFHFARQEHRYPNVDESVHLSHATVLHYHLREREPGWASALLRASRFYPPAVPLGMAATQFLFSENLRTGALLFNVLTTLLTALLVFVAGWKIVGAAGAWAAIFVYLSSPLTFRLGTQSYLDQGLVLAVWSAVILFALGGERSLCRPWFWVAVGAGLLVKWTFPLFLAGVATAGYLRLLRRGGPDERRRLIAFPLLCLVPFLFWAAINDWRLFALLRFANELGIMTQANPLPGELAFYTFYIGLIPREVLSFPLALLAFLGLIVAPRYGEAGRILSLHAASSFLFLTALLNKDARFIAPLLPAMSLLAAAFIGRLRWAPIGTMLVALVALLAYASGVPREGPRLITLAQIASAITQTHPGAIAELRLYFHDQTGRLNPYAAQAAAIMARTSLRRRPQVVMVSSCAEAHVCLMRPPPAVTARRVVLQDAYGPFLVTRAAGRIKSRTSRDFNVGR